MVYVYVQVCVRVYVCVSEEKISSHFKLRHLQRRGLMEKKTLPPFLSSKNTEQKRGEKNMEDD